MISVASEEFKRVIKSIRTIVIILIFVLLSYGTSSILNNFSTSTDTNISATYSTIRLLVFILGFLFVSILSNNCINKEIETGSVNFVLSKISRYNFIIGKFIGILLFWCVCIGISFMIISILNKQIDFIVFLMLLCIITYYISLCILFSVLISKSSITNFFGLVIGIFFPVLGITLTLSNEWYSIFKYLFPYEYILKGGFFIIFPLLMSIVFLGIAILRFSRKEV